MALTVIFTGSSPVQLRLARGDGRVRVVLAEQASVAVGKRVASLVLIPTHAYASVPVTVTAFTLVVLEAPSPIIKIGGQQVISVHTLSLCASSVILRLSGISERFIVEIITHCLRLFCPSEIGEQVAHLVGYVVAVPQFD